MAFIFIIFIVSPVSPVLPDKSTYMHEYTILKSQTDFLILHIHLAES